MALTKIRIEEIESMTSDLLKECYADEEIIPPINLNLLIQKSDLRVKFGIFKDQTIDGAFDRAQKTIFLSSSIPRARQIFTAAHELAHYYLHTNKSKEILYRKDPPSYELQEDELIEQEANWFAASLLMPKNLLYRLISEKVDSYEVAERFAVSAKAAFYRLKNLGLLLNE